LNLHELVYADLPAFEDFQCDQGRELFNCRHIVSCIKLSSRAALVVGAYDVAGPTALNLSTAQPPAALATVNGGMSCIEREGRPASIAVNTEAGQRANNLLAEAPAVVGRAAAVHLMGHPRAEDPMP
jgi:hypothetical protein